MGTIRAAVLSKGIKGGYLRETGCGWWDDWTAPLRPPLASLSPLVGGAHRCLSSPLLPSQVDWETYPGNQHQVPRVALAPCSVHASVCSSAKWGDRDAVICCSDDFLSTGWATQSHGWEVGGAVPRQGKGSWGQMLKVNNWASHPDAAVTSRAGGEGAHNPLLVEDQDKSCGGQGWGSLEGPLQAGVWRSRKMLWTRPGWLQTRCPVSP